MKDHCKHCRLSFMNDAAYQSHQDKCKEPKKAVSKTDNNTWVNYLTLALVVLLLLNVVVMGFYTGSVTSKLNDAVAEIMPQKGTLTVLLPENCDKCTSLDSQAQKLTSLNVEITDEETFYANTQAAKDLIRLYSINKLPAMVFETEDEMKAAIKSTLKQEARLEGDEIAIWEQEMAPYYDLSSNDIKGLVSVTFLTDNTCTKCHDPKARQVPILSRMGIVFDSEKTLDISEDAGKELLDKYSITKLPTIILSNDASAYPLIQEVWGEVGSVEGDGSYVFRDLSVLMDVYEDLETGKIIDPTQQ